MFIDLRKQKRKIIIELESEGSDSVKIDDYIDNVLKGLETILIQRQKPKQLKIEIILKKL